MSSEVLGNFENVEIGLKKYLLLVKKEDGKFKSFVIEHIPRCQNIEVDELSKLGLLTGEATAELFWSAIDEVEVMQIDQHPLWIDPFILYLSKNEFHPPVGDKRRFCRKVVHYHLIEGVHYKRTFLSPLAWCLTEEVVPIILHEIHLGWCGSQSSIKTLEKRILRQGYFWPTIRRDAETASLFPLSSSHSRISSVAPMVPF